MTELSVSLGSIEQCLQGLIPSWIATCSTDGVPNVTALSIVHYVDSERVALSRQFFNKTAANLQANPHAHVTVVDPDTMDEFALDLQFLHTETEGPTFERARASLDGIASQTGMADVFRLRGVDIYRVVDCVAARQVARVDGGGRQAGDRLGSLDELVRRLAHAADYATATRTGLEALEDLFGFRQSILLVADEASNRLFAVASNGYTRSSAGAEVGLGVGVIGIAAERRAVVCVPNVARGRAMRAGIEGALEQSGAEPPADEIPLPGLGAAQSAAAVPLIVRDELTGVLYLEAEQPGEFGPGSERLLRVIGGHLAMSLAALQEERGEPAHHPTTSRPDLPEGDEISVVYYQADDSIFVNREYVIKGVPGRILWKLLSEFEADGRTAFTNREIRLDEQLGLPAGNDNLEARLLVLRKRLAAAETGIGLERVGRGRLELRLERAVTLAEVATSGPMRAAHQAPDEVE